MEESTHDLNNCSYRDNSQFKNDESPLPPPFVYNTKIILGESDIIKLFENGLYKCNDDVINRFYYYLRRVDSHFKEWDSSFQLAYDLSRLLEPEPSDNYLPYYKSKKTCFCCHCLGLICLCEYIIDNYNDERIFKKIEKKLELYLNYNSNESPFFYDFLRGYIISISFEYCKELLSKFEVDTRALAPISDIMNDFELFKNKTINRFKAKYRPNLKMWLIEHTEISDQQIADFYAVLEKHEISQYLQSIKTQDKKCPNEVNLEDSPKKGWQCTKNSTTIDTETINSNNDQLCKNDNSSKEIEAIVYGMQYRTQKHKSVPYNDLFKVLKEYAKKIDFDINTFVKAISHGNLKEIWKDGVKVHLKVLVGVLRTVFEKDWYDSICESCQISDANMRGVKKCDVYDALRNEFNKII